MTLHSDEAKTAALSGDAHGPKDATTRANADEKRDVEFKARDGTVLRGWLFGSPDPKHPRPAVVMTHGFATLIAFGLEPFAVDLARAGFLVLVYDHRGWGLSDGEPRMETNPFQQMHDTRDAITFLSIRPEVDEKRIGVWGCSYSGGNALILAAVDRRVKCVVSVVPLVSGSAMTKRLVGEMNFDAHLERLYAARKAQALGEGVQYQTHTTYKETLEWYSKVDPEGIWQNKISVTSHDMSLEFEPMDTIHRIAPTPLLMVLTDHDTRVCTDLQLEAYEKAREPKRLVMLKGGHYDPYIELFAETSAAGRNWFVEHLQP